MLLRSRHPRLGNCPARYMVLYDERCTAKPWRCVCRLSFTCVYVSGVVGIVCSRVTGVKAPSLEPSLFQGESSPQCTMPSSWGLTPAFCWCLCIVLTRCAAGASMRSKMLVNYRGARILLSWLAVVPKPCVGLLRLA